jgi:AhpD family alkylhydroperoxidase
MNTFKKRIYRNIYEFIIDLKVILSRRKDIHILMKGEIIDQAFRERIMLAVTSVNKCRYCSYAHGREALSKGVSQEEIDTLEKGMFDGSPSYQIQALLYAQHWSETNGKPEVNVRNKVILTYGENKVELMELAMRMIRSGNLLGNTFDYLLYKISFGKWGNN